MKWQHAKVCKSYLRDKGYTKAIPVEGEVGFSELSIATKTAFLRGRYAFVKPSGPMNYAFVLLEDGTILEGCFHLFDDGSFSLS